MTHHHDGAAGAGSEEVVQHGLGGRVVEVIAAAGRVPEDALWRVLGHTTRPDVVLLTGGTDGGNTQAIVDAAKGIVAGGWTGPVVVAVREPWVLVRAFVAAPVVIRSGTPVLPLLMLSILLSVMLPAVAASVPRAVARVAVPMTRALVALLRPMPPLTPPVPAVMEMLPLVALSAPVWVAPVIEAAPVVRTPVPVTEVAADRVMLPVTAV